MLIDRDRHPVARRLAPVVLVGGLLLSQSGCVVGGVPPTPDRTPSVAPATPALPAPGDCAKKTANLYRGVYQVDSKATPVNGPAMHKVIGLAATAYVGGGWGTIAEVDTEVRPGDVDSSSAKLATANGEQALRQALRKAGVADIEIGTGQLTSYAPGDPTPDAHHMTVAVAVLGDGPCAS